MVFFTKEVHFWLCHGGMKYADRRSAPAKLRPAGVSNEPSILPLPKWQDAPRLQRDANLSQLFSLGENGPSTR